jgi:hypothetical protein
MDADHLTSLFQRAADDELSPEEHDRLRQACADDPAADARIEFERALRRRVGAVMEPVDVPPEVEGRVRRILAGESLGRIRPRAVTRRANLFAVAATLAIVAGAILFGIFGPQIDRIRGRYSGEDLVAEAAVFASREHGRCAGSNEALRDKTVYADPDGARRFLEEHLGHTPPIFDLERLGFVFAGAGPCAMPAAERSGHLIYVREGEPGPALLSIFVLTDRGRFDDGAGGRMSPGAWYPSEGGPQCRHTVLRSSDGESVYFLVCCDDRVLESLSGAVSEQLHASDR